MPESSADLHHLLKDLLSGDESVSDHPLFKGFSVQDVVDGYKILMQNEKLSDREKALLAQDSWRLHYKAKPPTIEEFLGPEYLGATSYSVWPYIKDSLMQFWNPQAKYRHAIVSCHIGWGKSYFSVISALFITVRLMLMKDPKAYYGFSPATIIAIALISFSMDKASETLLEPMMEILDATDKFEQCKTVDSFRKKEKEYGIHKFVWTTASPTSVLMFNNGIRYKLLSDPAKLLGVTFISSIMSELSFFKEKGFSDDYVWRILQKSKGRITSRFDDNKDTYLARTILDSSPNDMDTKLDTYIWQEAPKDKSNFIVKGSMWEWQSHKFTKPDAFKIHLGNAASPPRLLNPSEYSSYDPTEILSVPDNDSGEYLALAEQDIIEFLKDIAGIPAGTPDKLIHDKGIIEKMFTTRLRNRLTCAFANYTDEPRGLLWNDIKNEFFIALKDNHYQFYRYPAAPRYIAIDQSISGDTTGFTMLHVENEMGTGRPIYVVDFTLPIVPKKSRINLDAIKHLIKDLRDKGRIPIRMVGFDHFESEGTFQFLERENIPAEKLTVDGTMGPYITLINLMNQGQVKAGKNIFLKNNFHSLYIKKSERTGYKKVDHYSGKISDAYGNTDWNMSDLGKNAKDVSDTLAAAVFLAQKYQGDFSGCIWDESCDTERTERDVLFSKLGKKGYAPV